MDKIILGATERHLKDNAIIGHSQQGFTKQKYCLANLISFYDKVAHLVEEGKPVDAIFLDFSKSFDTVCHNIFLDKLSNSEMSKYTVKCVKNYLNGMACTKWGYIWLVTSHHQCSSRINSGATSV